MRSICDEEARIPLDYLAEVSKGVDPDKALAKAQRRYRALIARLDAYPTTEAAGEEGEWSEVTSPGVH